MGIIKEKYTKLEVIQTVAILADPGCREGWQKNIRENTILFSHVPPETKGWTFHSFWPRSSNLFLEVVSKHQDCIKMMFFGHIHGFTQRSYLDIPMIITGAVAESNIVRNKRYDGLGFFEMIIFDVKTGKTAVCSIE